jgi:hypothetical protein
MSTQERRSEGDSSGAAGESTGTSAVESAPTGVAREFAPEANSVAPHASVIHRAVRVNCIIIEAAIIEAEGIGGIDRVGADPCPGGESLAMVRLGKWLFSHP